MPTVVAGGIAAVTGLSATATGVVVASNLLLYAGTSAASYFLQQALAPGAPKQEYGTKLRTVLGGAVNQSFIFGQQVTAGSFLFKGTWGRGAASVPNAFVVKVYALSDLPVNGFASYMWAGGRKCSIDTGTNDTIDGLNVGHPVPAFNRNGRRLWVKFYTGSQVAADPYLRAKFGSGNRAWAADMIGRGRAYAIVTQKYDKKEPAGEVDPLFVVSGGAKIYDWRDGAQVYGTRGTYTYNSNNPIVLVYNIIRGIYYNDEWMYGGQALPAACFDIASFTAAANVCDEDVALAAGGTQKRYRVGGELDLSEDPWTVIERLLKACNGRIVESGGVFKVYAGGIGASVFSFADDDVLVSESLTAKFFPARDEIANTIVGSYVEPDNAGEAKAYKSRTKADYLAADGGEVRKQSFDLEYVNDNRRAQRLAKLALNDNRRFRTFVVAFWTAARKLEPCDVVSWTSDRFGFTNKKFIVGDVTLRADGVVIANLREADAADADWSTGDEDAYDVGVFEDIETPAQTIAVTISPAAVTDDDGSNRRPAIRMQAALNDDFVDCKALLWEVRKRLGDQAVIADGRNEAFFDPDSPRFGDITVSRNAFLPNKRVQARFKVEPESDRETDWSDWADVSVYPGGLDYLTLTNARLKVATETSDNDVDQVDTPNIVAKAVENHAAWSPDDDTQTWTTSTNRSVTRGMGAEPITNKNPSAVIIGIKCTITAGTNVGDAPQGEATRKVRLRIFSEKAADGSNRYACYDETVTASAKKGKPDSASKKISLFIVDTYDSPDRRRYRAQVDHVLKVNGQAHNVTSGGSVKNLSVKLLWWRA